MSRLRLAYVCSDPGIAPDGTKGASVHFREFGRALGDAGFAVNACVVRKPKGPFTEFPLEVCRPAHRPSSNDPVAQELLGLVDQSPMLTALARIEAPDVVYERYSLWGLAGLAHARSSGLPFFLEVNAPLWEEARTYRNLALVRVAKAVARELFEHATRILVVSSALADRLAAEGVPRERIVHFPNGVSPLFRPDVTAAPRPREIGDRPTLVFVGSFKPWHGIDFLVSGFEALMARSAAALWLVGDGPLAKSVDAFQSRHPDRVVRSPAVPHHEVPGVLKAADAVVVPYTKDAPNYFCPLKTVEALAVGVPILASDVTANRGLDLGDAAVNWFSAGDQKSFVDAALRLLQDRETEVERAARTNPPLVEERFTWAQRGRELADMVSGGGAQVPPGVRAAHVEVA